MILHLKTKARNRQPLLIQESSREGRVNSSLDRCNSNGSLQRKLFIDGSENFVSFPCRSKNFSLENFNINGPSHSEEPQRSVFFRLRSNYYWAKAIWQIIFTETLWTKHATGNVFESSIPDQDCSEYWTKKIWIFFDTWQNRRVLKIWIINGWKH